MIECFGKSSSVEVHMKRDILGVIGTEKCSTDKNILRRGSGTAVTLGILLGSGLLGTGIGLLANSCETKFTVSTKYSKEALNRSLVSNIRIDSSVQVDSSDGVQYRIEAGYGGRAAFRNAYIKSIDSMLDLTRFEGSETLTLKINKIKCSREGAQLIENYQVTQTFAVSDRKEVRRFIYEVDFGLLDAQGGMILKGVHKEWVDKDLSDIPSDEWRSIIIGFQKDLVKLFRSREGRCKVKEVAK